jgi:hypothetical protein
MTKKSEPGGAKKPPDVVHPGMMGDGTEEQNLSEPGDPGARITKEDVGVAFDKPEPKKA